MAREDWRTTATILIMTLLVLVFFVYAEQEHHDFQVGARHIKYHANWSSDAADLHNVKQLQEAYKSTQIKELDISLSMSTLSIDNIKTILPTSFNVYDSIKLNLANNPIGTDGADYILSLIPNGVKELQIAFDSIDADGRLGHQLTKRINNLNSLKKLKISLIMAVSNESVVDDYLRYGRLGENLESYSLVLIGNDLTNSSLGYLKTHLGRANLKELDLNFYANKLGAEGAQTIADAILSQKNLNELSLDVYFNNITEVGTEALSKSLSEINNPNLLKLHYNLDFNYIKNQGSKAVGKTLSEMKQLKSLSLGVASKNFGYLGFKYIVNGLNHLTELQEFSFKCGVNRVGPGGAELTRDALKKMPKLKKLSINFYQNYVGDEGLIQLTKAITDLKDIQSVYLNYGFNDAKGYCLIKILELFATKQLADLFISFSSNQFQDSEINLVKDQLRQIISKTGRFEMEFMETAISKKKARELEKLFEVAEKSSGNVARINVNSVISEDQAKKYDDKAEDRESKLKQLREKDKQGDLKSITQKEQMETQQGVQQKETTQNQEL